MYYRKFYHTYQWQAGLSENISIIYFKSDVNLLLCESCDFLYVNLFLVRICIMYYSC